MSEKRIERREILKVRAYLRGTILLIGWTYDVDRVGDALHR